MKRISFGFVSAVDAMSTGVLGVEASIGPLKDTPTSSLRSKIYFD